MELDPNNQYTRMQKDVYSGSSNGFDVNNVGSERVVAFFNDHNNHADYELLFTDIENPHKIMLDFGCGPGRNLVKYHSRFARIDGADIIQQNLDNAHQWLKYNGIAEYGNLYLTDGISLDTVPSDTYDIVMSVITFQHIAVYDIRYNILKDMLRVLKSDGWITIQMGYGPDRPSGVPYHSNDYSIGGTNGSNDVLVVNVDDIRNDLTSLGYRNFSFTISRCGPGDLHNQWIFFRAQK